MQKQRRSLSTILTVVVVLAASLIAADGPRVAIAAASPATEPSAPDVPMAEHADTVVTYTLRAKLDPVLHTVHGEGSVKWKNVSSKPISELWMHLYLNAFKNQSSVFMRAPIGGFRGSTLPADWGAIDVTSLKLKGDDLKATMELRRANDEDETDARIPLPTPVQPGEEITLEMAWDDKLPEVVERTGYSNSFHMVAQWFPKIAKLEPDGTFAHFPFHHLGEFYSDFGKFDVTIDVPTGFIVGATGPAVETKEEGGRHIERHVLEDIHEFAWTAWDHFEVHKEKIDGVDVTVLVPPHYDDHAARELETMRFALPHFGARYGKYPYNVLTVVHPPASAPEAGGMEYPTLITTGQPSWVPRGMYFVEGVTIHEFGHQYFYGLCASNEDAWPFLDEGLNSYAEGESMDAFKGAASGLDFFGIKVGDGDALAERARHYGHDEKVAQGAGAFATGNAYGALVYARTATILHTIARAYGKQKMDRAMGVYTRRFRFKHPTPNDFIEVIRTEIGPSAAENLRAALFDKAWVDYSLSQIASYAAHPPAGMFDRNGKRETVPAPKLGERTNKYEGYALITRRGTLRFPVQIELVADDGTRSRIPWDGESESIRVPYAGASPLRAVVVDPDDTILLDDHPENNFATAQGHSSGGAPRIRERAMYWAASMLGGLAP